MCRAYNEQSAALCRERPELFKFAAALPLPDVDLAIKEAVYAMDSLGAVGVKIASNSRGMYLGDEVLDPLMEVLNEKKALLIIHPHKPEPVNEGLIKTTPMAMYEYLAETTRAVMNMISRNVPARYPNVKIIVPHCGSFLPLTIPCYKSLLPLFESMKFLPKNELEANLANLYYDLAGAPEISTIKEMLTITTPDHLVYGSDFPYVAPQVLENNLQKLKSSVAKDKELSPYLDDFLYGNARRLLGLSQETKAVDSSKSKKKGKEK